VLRICRVVFVLSIAARYMTLLILSITQLTVALVYSFKLRTLISMLSLRLSVLFDHYWNVVPSIHWVKASDLGFWLIWLVESSLRIYMVLICLLLFEEWRVTTSC
jgi:hypothetical protein